MSAVTVTNTTEEHVEQLEALQRLIFPTLTDEELFTAEKYRRHIATFPEGQFVALLEEDGQQVIVGSTTTLRRHFDFDHIQHTFMEAIGHGWLTTHEPDGEWLYGADLMVHPDYRRRGVGSALYRARMELVKKLNLRGEIAGGMLPGYERYHDQMSIETYVDLVAQGELTDPTLSMQIHNGFRPRGILYNHITDPRSHDCAALIVRENPDYRP